MAINTTLTTNVGQIDRSPSTNGLIHKTDQQSASPFQPETQVDIENSIKSTLAALTKSVMNKGIPTEEMPEELQKMIDTLMQNAFSVDSSLSKGLSDLMQSQRFTIDQLNLLAKFVEQLGNLVDANEISDLPAALKTFLANLSLLDGDNGKLLDSVNLNKLAFQLLEGKSIADFPEVLQFILMQNASNVNVPPQQAEGMNFLKQLVKFFLPNPSAGENAQGNPTGTQQNKQSATPDGTANTGQSTNLNQPAAAKQNTTSVAQNQQNTNPTTNQSNANALPGQAQGQGGTNTNATVQNQTGSQSSANQPGPQGQGGTNTNTTVQNQTGQQSNTNQLNMQGQSSSNTSAGQPGTNLAQGQNTNSPTQNQAGQPSANTMQTPQQSSNSSQNGVTRQVQVPLQNTPATMQLMKSLAGQMLGLPNLTETQGDLLKNFINNGQEVFSKQELNGLQKLLQMSEQNLPAYIRQAAIKQNLPDLPKLWAFIQLSNLTRLLDLPANRLKTASKNISDFSTVLRKSMQSEEGITGSQRSLSFMTPIYFGDNKHCYPAYIHLYHESDDENGKEQSEQQKETWLRMCMMTEHVGAVELVFRLYEQKNINLRLSFSNEAVVDSFNEYIPELQSAFEMLPLNLTDIKVSAIGE